MTILEMNLKIKGWRNVIRWAVWSVLGILFLVFLIRVAIFENDYYNGKEGTERVVVEENEDEEELDETEPTETEISEYKVAVDRPRYLTIEKMGVKNARILPMGVNAKGELSTPNNIFDVGWYENSGKPGQGGVLIIDGHNGGPHIHGVFKDLPNLKSGDIVQIERGDGKLFKYKIVENTKVALADADEYMTVAASSPEPGKEALTLISCTGEWSQSQKTYLSRQFIRAVLVEN